jgi:hypothetical protein
MEMNWTQSLRYVERYRWIENAASNGKLRPICIVISTNRLMDIHSFLETLTNSLGDSNLLRCKSSYGTPLVKIRLDLFDIPHSISDIHETIELFPDIIVDMSPPENSNLSKSNQGDSVSKISPSSLQISRKRQLILAREEVQNLTNPIIVLMDDDLTFDNLLIKDNTIFSDFPFSYLHEIYCLNRENPSLDVALGGVTGSPPLPSSSSLLISLLDASSKIEVQEKSPLRWKNPDYYYDLSDLRDSWDSWIEPTWYFSETSSLSVSEKILQSILFSGPIRRPLVLVKDPIDSNLTHGYIRGGNTVVFSHIWLQILEHPNIDRRADTIWALTIHHLGGNVMHMPYTLRHRRTSNEITNSSIISRMHDDLFGSSLQRAYVKKGDFNDLISIFQERNTRQIEVIDNCKKLVDSLMKIPFSQTKEHGKYSFWALSIKERLELLTRIRMSISSLRYSLSHNLSNYHKSQLERMHLYADAYLFRSEIKYNQMRAEENS